MTEILHLPFPIRAAEGDDDAHDGEGQVVSITGGQKLKAGEFVVPSDPSSAAFLLAAGLVAPASDVTIEGHMTNPTRSGFLKVIEGMADVELTNERTVSGETVVDVKVSRRDGLNATNPPVELVPAMIDEFPIFAVLGSWHQDLRKCSSQEGYREFCAKTPFLPFTGRETLRGLRELSPVAVVIGAAVAIVLRWYHHLLF